MNAPTPLEGQPAHPVGALSGSVASYLCRPMLTCTHFDDASSWQVYLDDWTNFDPTSNAIIAKARRDGEMHALVTARGIAYVVDFAQSLQYQKSDRKRQRMIRLYDSAASSSSPSGGGGGGSGGAAAAVPSGGGGGDRSAGAPMKVKPKGKVPQNEETEPTGTAVVPPKSSWFTMSNVVSVASVAAAGLAIGVAALLTDDKGKKKRGR